MKFIKIEDSIYRIDMIQSFFTEFGGAGHSIFISYVGEPDRLIKKFSSAEEANRALSDLVLKLNS